MHVFGMRFAYVSVSICGGCFCVYLEWLSCRFAVFFASICVCFRIGVWLFWHRLVFLLLVMMVFEKMVVVFVFICGRFGIRFACVSVSICGDCFRIYL